MPAFYSDHYVPLLPGETKPTQMCYPRGKGKTMDFMLSEWNVVAEASVPVR